VLKEIYSEVLMGSHLSNSPSAQNGRKQGDVTLIFNFPLEYAVRKVKGDKEGI
jgi:hypothetical protein